MNIESVYNTLGIPPNLQEHMFMVTAIAMFICDHWQGEVIDKDLIKKACLLHDVGNIVKFDFIKHPEFLGEEQKRIDYWINKQKEVIEKYGSDDHDATDKMLREIGVEQKLIDIVQAKSFGQAIETESSGNWELKILFYSDMRVTPKGISTLEERLNDIVTRLEKYKNHPDKEKLLDVCRKIELQIQENIDLSLSEITQTNIQDESTLLITEI